MWNLNFGDQKKHAFQKELLIKKFNFGASGDPTPVLDEAQSKKWNAMKRLQSFFSN